MARLFAVIRSRGPAWENARRMEDQQDRHAHATFMNMLYAEGSCLLVGPLEETSDVLMIASADSAEQINARLADDPWSDNGLLRTRLVAPWTLRLGSPAAAPR